MAGLLSTCIIKRRRVMPGRAGAAKAESNPVVQKATRFQNLPLPTEKVTYSVPSPLRAEGVRVTAPIPLRGLGKSAEKVRRSVPLTPLPRRGEEDYVKGFS
jgi:hypothetical protein